MVSRNASWQPMSRSGESTQLTVSPDQLDLIKRTVAQGATDEELRLFLYDCTRRNVHPLDKLIFFTKRSGKYTPITSIDFMRSRAAESGEYAGNDEPVFPPLALAVKYPETATVTVWRMVQGARCAFTATARWGEYYPGEGKDGFMWRKMPYVMLGKCAEALALRKGFPQQLAGLYASEELDQAKTLTDPGKPVTRKQLDEEAIADRETGEVLVDESWPEDVHLITQINLSTGKAGKRNWKLWTLTTHRDKEFSTFEGGVAAAAETAQLHKKPVQITAEQKSEKYAPTIVELAPYQPETAEVF